MYKPLAIFSLVLCLSLINTFSTSAKFQAPQLPKEVATISVVQTPDGPQLKIQAGDLVCTTKELKAQRKKEEPWTVKPVGGQVEMRRGDKVNKGPIIKVLLRF